MCVDSYCRKHTLQNRNTKMCRQNFGGTTGLAEHTDRNNRIQKLESGPGTAELRTSNTIAQFGMPC
jgi:hypothetical protein